jgi:hypothetical protein
VAGATAPTAEIVLGIDPGLKHTGWAVLTDGRPTAHGVLLFPEDGKHPTEEYVRFVLQGLSSIVNKYRPAQAAVEQVQWHGRRQRITMPLSHVAGAVTGYLVACGLPVCLLTPNMKKGVTYKQPKGWSDHEYDAALLAKKLLLYRDAERAGESSDLQRLDAVRRRIIIVTDSAPGSPSNGDSTPKKKTRGKR